MFSKARPILIAYDFCRCCTSNVTKHIFTTITMPDQSKIQSQMFCNSQYQKCILIISAVSKLIQHETEIMYRLQNYKIKGIPISHTVLQSRNPEIMRDGNDINIYV